MTSKAKSDFSFTTTSPQATIDAGTALGALLGVGDTVALYGELGSGKTVFTRGVALGAGVPDGLAVVSPTFTLMNEYPGAIPIRHLDLYRLSSAEDLRAVCLDEICRGDGLTIIEWSERAEGALPEDYLAVTLEHVSAECRQIAVAPHGEEMGQLARMWLGQM